MKKTLLFLATSLTLGFAGCSKDDDNKKDNNCFADAITLTETDVNNLTASNAIIVSFDAKNTSGSAFDIQQGSKPVYVKVIVTTTDNATYESSQILTVTSLSAGATASTEVLATYGSGKTYKSYRIESKYCQ